MIRPDETVKPWYKETPKALVASIVADKAWDRLPILADALEDAGCDNYLLLDTLRLPVPPQSVCGSWLERVAAGVVSVPEADMAVHSLTSLADEFVDHYSGRSVGYERAGMDPLDWMLYVLEYYLTTGDTYHCSGYDNPDMTEARWGAYCALTGTDPKETTDSWEEPSAERTVTYPKSPFSCSC